MVPAQKWRPPRSQRRHEGAIVQVVKLAANWYAVGQARDANATMGKGIGEIVGRRLPIHGRAQRQNDLCHVRVGCAVNQATQAQIFRPGAVQRGEGAAKHMVLPFISAAAFQRP